MPVVPTRPFFPSTSFRHGHRFHQAVVASASASAVSLSSDTVEEQQAQQQPLPPQQQYGVGMDQNAMMESDLLVIVDEMDRLLYSEKDSSSSTTSTSSSSSPTLMMASKKLAHSFHPEQPRGICHRAFSLFIFDENDNLLLTQRASSKITFPGVWTNTCCSHPLQGMSPNEVDDDELDAYPNYMGIKHAAIRKAQHELGITTLELSDMTFVSRFHYWASDVGTHGIQSPWGEHEVDYILFCRLSQEKLSNLHLDPEEVASIRYVSPSELQTMMEESMKTPATPTTPTDPTDTTSSSSSYQHIKWSPWFLGMMERGVMDWWKDLDNTLQGVNTNREITFFDPHVDFWAEFNLPTHTRTTGCTGGL